MALNRKYSYLKEYTIQMPDFVSEYIIEYTAEKALILKSDMLLMCGCF